MDIHLASDLDGLYAAKKIRDFSQAPIIFMTGYPDEDLKEETKNLKPVGYIGKPLKIIELNTTIHSILDF